jgi:hypothetical protein
MQEDELNPDPINFKFASGTILLVCIEQKKIGMSINKKYNIRSFEFFFLRIFRKKKNIKT